MTSEALQNPYLVRLYCKNIDKTHSLTEPNDKIQFHGNYFLKKGGEPLWKRGGTDPLSPPPPKSALDNDRASYRESVAQQLGTAPQTLELYLYLSLHYGAVWGKRIMVHYVSVHS